jgi:hypothetical protein
MGRDNTENGITLSMPFVHLRLTEEEYDGLMSAAKLRGMSKSEVLRAGIQSLRANDMEHAILNWQDVLQTNVIEALTNCMKTCFEGLSRAEGFKERAYNDLGPLIDRTALMDRVLERYTAVKKRKGRPPKASKG